MFKDFNKSLLSNGSCYILRQKYHKLFINEYLYSIRFAKQVSPIVLIGGSRCFWKLDTFQLQRNDGAILDFRHDKGAVDMSHTL
jgi:hypothetical protein